MTVPPEPLRSRYLAMLANQCPWFAVGRDVMFLHRRMTIRRIDPDSWSFHTEEPGHEKWLKWRLYDVLTQFKPAPSPLDKVDSAIDG